MSFEVLYGVLAIVTLLMGAVLNILIFLLYQRLKDRTLLIFNLGLFLLIIGIVFSDMVTMVQGETVVSFWSIVIARLFQIAGIGCMITGVIR